MQARPGMSSSWNFSNISWFSRKCPVHSNVLFFVFVSWRGGYYLKQRLDCWSFILSGLYLFLMRMCCIQLSLLMFSVLILFFPIAYISWLLIIVARCHRLSPAPSAVPCHAVLCSEDRRSPRLRCDTGVSGKRWQPSDSFPPSEQSPDLLAVIFQERLCRNTFVALPFGF